MIILFDTAEEFDAIVKPGDVLCIYDEDCGVQDEEFQVADTLIGNHCAIFKHQGDVSKGCEDGQRFGLWVDDLEDLLDLKIERSHQCNCTPHDVFNKGCTFDKTGVCRSNEGKS